MNSLIQTLLMRWLAQHEIYNRQKRLEQEKIVIDTRRVNSVQIKVLCERVDNKRAQGILVELVRNRWIIRQTFEFEVLDECEEVVVGQLSLKKDKYPTD